jgi:2,5-furandicarboxylate decarboxylase 1
MIQDLRDFLAALKAGGQLLEFTKPVNPVHELGAVLASLEKKGLGAALFTRVAGYGIPVAGGLLSDHRKIGIALECRPEDISARMDSMLSAAEFPQPTLWTSGIPPCQEEVLVGDDADFAKLPIPVHAPLDGGPFVTAGVAISRSISGGRQNLSYQRMHIKNARRSGFMINQWRHARYFLDEAEQAGKALPISVAVGVDPAIMIAAGVKTDRDEMELACALRGRPIEMVKSITNDILVPARSEFILEGFLGPGEYEEEGPLAEFTVHYGNPWKSPVFTLTAVTHRKNPIWQTLNGASYEHINLGNVLPREPKLKQLTQYVSKGVRAVHIPPYGAGFLALVSMDKTHEGEPKNVAMAAMSSHINIKSVIVVDGDVDIFNPADVLWSLATRFNPTTDLFTVPNAQGHELDPSGDHGLMTKMGMDATYWLGRKRQTKVVYPDIDANRFL